MQLEFGGKGVPQASGHGGLSKVCRERDGFWRGEFVCLLSMRKGRDC